MMLHAWVDVAVAVAASVPDVAWVAVVVAVVAAAAIDVIVR